MKRFDPNLLQGLGWSAIQWQGGRKGDGQKIRIAARLGRETTMTLNWIGGHLAMGSWTQVSNLLAAARK